MPRVVMADFDKKQPMFFCSNPDFENPESWNITDYFDHRILIQVRIHEETNGIFDDELMWGYEQPATRFNYRMKVELRWHGGDIPDGWEKQSGIGGYSGWWYELDQWDDIRRTYSLADVIKVLKENGFPYSNQEFD